MSRIIALTDVPYAEVRHPKGTKFEVVDEPKAGAVPVQVDPTTAGRWLRDAWAQPIADAPVKAK